MIIIILGGVSLTALFAVWALFAIDEGLADQRLRKRNIEEDACGTDAAMLRVAAMLAVLLTTTAASAQTSIFSDNSIFSNTVDPEDGVPLHLRKRMSPDGWMSPDDRRRSALSLATAPLPPPPARIPIVINGGKGGSIPEHISRFGMLGSSGALVEMRGGCYSACTLITAHVPKERLCFAPGSFLAFHAATWTPVPPHRVSPDATLKMYQSYPIELRQWIDRNGGYEKLTVESYWTMYDRELWAIGYSRCP